MVTNEIQSERVVLELLGIDKKWVRSPKGHWVDKKILEQEASARMENTIEETEIPQKRWWQFWK